MPIQILKDIIKDGEKYQKAGPIGTLVDKVEKLISGKYTPETEIYKALNDLSMKETLDKAIETCKDNSNPLITIIAASKPFLAKLTQLKNLINSPAEYFETLVNDGSDLFHDMNVPLQDVLFTTEPTIHITDTFKGRFIYDLVTLNTHLRHRFHEVQDMMECATTMLTNPELKKDDNIKYLEGRITRRLKEMPVSENLLKIRTQMNKLEDSKDNDISSLNQAITNAADTWRPIYLEMKHLQESYIAKKGKEGETFTDLDERCLKNFGYVANRIDKAITTLDKAFKNCVKKNIISEEHYAILSDNAYSSLPYRPSKK